MHFAWKAFQFQASLCLHQRVGHRPLSAAQITRIGSMTNKRRLKSASAVPPAWVDRKSNNEEEIAAAKIQATFRGYFLRKLARAYVKGMFLLHTSRLHSCQTQKKTIYYIAMGAFALKLPLVRSLFVSKDCKQVS